MKEKTVLVKVREDLSLDDLTVLLHEGYSVIRTNHLGNLPPRDLILLQSRLPCVLFDRNICAPRRLASANSKREDTIFLPESICCGGERRIIAEPEIEKIAHSLPLSGRHELMDKLGEKFFSPAAVHLAGLKKLFGRLIETESQYFIRHEDILRRLLSSAGLAAFFDRSVANGRVEKRSGSFSSMSYLIEESFAVHRSLKTLAEGGEAEVTGALFSNPLAIVLMSAIESFVSGKNNVFQLAGCQMADYIKGKEFVSKMQEIYSLLCLSDVNLPDCLEINVAPTAVIAPFIILPHFSRERRRLLYDIGKITCELTHLSDSKRRKLNGSKNSQGILRTISQKEQELFRNVFLLLSSGFSDGFHCFASSVFTQYDLLLWQNQFSLDSKPALPEGIRSLPFGFLSRLYQECHPSISYA